MMPKRPPKGRNVKSGVARDSLRDGASTADGAADRHERGKDYLSEAEIGALRSGATKAGRHSVCEPPAPDVPARAAG